MTPPAYQTNSKLFGLEIWPFSHILGMMMLPKATQETAKQIKPAYKVHQLHTSITDCINGIPGRILPFYVVTLICLYFYPLEQQMQESKVAIQKFMDGDKDLSNHMWLFKLTARDLISSLILPPLWQYLIDQPNVRMVKINKDYTPAKNYKREIFYSISTILMGTFYEALCMFLYAQGYVTNYFMDWRSNVLAYWGWILLNPVWRDAHFYWVHRAMHHWNTKYIPDVGKWLYEVSHYVHHQSRNVQPWSGVSMHPIEGFLYESGIMIPILFTHHPIIIVVTKVDLIYAAILGHDGYEYPGHGDWMHQVHHMKIKCNYGTANAPFDWLFGSVDPGDDMDHITKDKCEKYIQSLEKGESSSNESKKKD